MSGGSINPLQLASNAVNPFMSLPADLAKPLTGHNPFNMFQGGLPGIFHSGQGQQTPGMPNQLPSLGINPQMYGGSFKMPSPTGDTYNDMAQQLAGPAYIPRALHNTLSMGNAMGVPQMNPINQMPLMKRPNPMGPRK